MEYIIIAFRSRAHTVKFADFLSKNRLPCEIVNTPKEAGVGCGLSVKTSPTYLAVLKRAVKKVGLNSFAGFFAVKILANKKFVRPI